MQAMEVIEALKGKKGQHVQAVWQRPAKTFKGCNVMVFKKTTAYVRSGIQYANLQDVRNAIEMGEREPVQGLPYGQWREGFTNYIIDDGDKEYVRLYPAVFDNLKPQVEWLLDGEVVPFERVKPYLLASEKSSREKKSACFNVNAAHILSIAGE